MAQYELNVGRGSRLLIGTIILGISFTGLFIYGLENKIFLIPISIFILLFALIHLLSFAKMNLKFSGDKIEIGWKKRFLFDNKDIEPINIEDIEMIVVDEGKFLRKIITKDRIVEINNGRPVNHEFVHFLGTFIQNILRNNGQVIDTKKYFRDYDNNFYVVITTGFSLALISRLWDAITFYSLLILLIPLTAYIIKARKKN